MANGWHRSYRYFRSGLAESPDDFFSGIANGSMTVELFEPQGRDLQTPHPQDELYIVRQGHGRLDRAGEVIDVATGDVIFIGAGVEHRFVTFSEDFSVWVVFWGPVGGEGNTRHADRRDETVRPG